MYAYMDLLERSYEVDIAEARYQKTAQTNKILKRYARLVRARSGRGFGLNDQQFKKTYGLTKELCRQLISELTPHMPPVRRSDGMDVETKVLVALAFYATGSYQSIVGDSLGHCLSQASVCKAIQQVTLALNMPAMLEKYIAFPLHKHEREKLKKEFYRKYNIPALGCIAGTHVAIRKPVENDDRYFTRNKYYSLNLQIMCDSNLNILSVDASNPGSTHDSVVWANHPLNSYLEEINKVSGEELYVLGDSGYELSCTTMTPVSDPEPDTPEQYFQDLHLTAMNVAERCLATLKARFRCLLVERKLYYSPEVAARIANACCVLHNLANKADIPYTPLTTEEAARELRLTDGACAAPAQYEHDLSLIAPGSAQQRALIQRLWEEGQLIMTCT